MTNHHFVNIGMNVLGKTLNELKSVHKKQQEFATENHHKIYCHICMKVFDQNEDDQGLTFDYRCDSCDKTSCSSCEVICQMCNKRICKICVCLM